MILMKLESLKNRWRPIIGMLLILLLLVGLEYILTPSKKKRGTLTEGPIQIDSLVINEIMSANKGAHADLNGEIYDWIELYNGTSKDIDLGGYGLSDQDSGHTKWIFPSVTIKSKEYVVIYLSGRAESGLHANFSLNKAGGETITLKNKNGKVIDAVKTVSLQKNMVMARDEKGNWQKRMEFTPGYSNNQEGRKAYIDSLQKEEDDLEITEFLPANKGNILLEGNFYSYIEIHNRGEKEVLLKDYFVSNDINKPFQYRLPNLYLKPNEVYLICTSELSKGNHANFTLNKKNGVVLLSNKNKIVEKVSYENLVNGFAYIKDIDGKFHINTNITPGYLNEKITEFSKEERKNPSELMISEVMSFNQSYLVQNGGEYYDWIELYNNTDHEIDLSKYQLTLSEANKQMYKLPNRVLKSGEYYLLMASGNSNLSNSKYEHTNFKISSSESIYLYRGDTLVDSVFFSSIPIGYSYGRNSTNGFYYFSKPTPGIANGESDILQMPID